MMIRWKFIANVAFVMAMIIPGVVSAETIDECRAMLMRGKLQECIDATAAEIEKGAFGEAWHQLKAEAELESGKYQDAMETIEAALERYGWSIRLRWLAIQAAPFVGQTERRDTLSEEIAKLVQGSPWRYTDAENLVTLGDFVLYQGADAKQAQDAFYSRARRNNPTHRRPILALGNLALEKRDFQLAAEIFQPALESHAEDPDVAFGLAQAVAGSDPERAQLLLAKTLELNPNHLGALRTQAENLIDGEQYVEAEQVLDKMFAVNPAHPEGWALRAVIAHVQGDQTQEEKSREQAFSHWAENPAVEHLYGRKLSQKYRFAEGAEAQRRALTFDPDHLPAKKQLAQDLLRLGQEEEGWQLADEAYQQDEYDIGMYNLITLREELEQFETIHEGTLLIRMDQRESRIYGHRVARLLAEARDTLCNKYQLDLDDQILVEIFPKQSDFAVRTFGIPGVAGFLGVCFGDVITANSPASQQASPTNLESVLWHEFAHVVTLNKTNNKMPRWLSEGISVYEERQRDSAWGERMSPRYRSMILEGELTPVSELSSAFLSPPTPVHLQFAYFESSLVVEHLVAEYGFDSLLKILDDLAVGIGINSALERNTVPLKQLDEEFEKFARNQAEEFGSQIAWTDEDWGEISPEADPKATIQDWLKKHPDHYFAIKKGAALLARAGDRDAAIELYEQAMQLFPGETGSDSPAIKLAEIYREQGDPEKEKAILAKYVAQDDDATNALLRLIVLSEESGDWEGVADYSERLLAVKPLISEPHQSLARSAEELGKTEAAVEALHSLLALEPNDPVDVRYRLAVQLEKAGDHAEAEKHLLDALESAPRYRDALRLLKRFK